MNDLQRINYVDVNISISIILSELCMHILCLPDCLCFGVYALLSTEYVYHSSQSSSSQATDGFITAVSPLLYKRLTALPQRSDLYFKRDWWLYHSGQTSTLKETDGSQETDDFITAVRTLLHIRLTALSQRSDLYSTGD